MPDTRSVREKFDDDYATGFARLALKDKSLAGYVLVLVDQDGHFILRSNQTGGMQVFAAILHCLLKLAHKMVVDPTEGKD